MQALSRVRMGALAEHDIQENQANIFIYRLLPNAPDAQVVIDHGVQTAHGKFICTQI